MIRLSGVARRVRAHRPPRSELALAAGATAVMAADVGQAAWPALALLLVVPAGLSLAWRLQAPFVPLVLTCGVDVLLLSTAPGQYGPQTTFLGVVLAVYTSAAHLTGRRAWLAGMFSLVALWVAHVASNEGDTGDFWPFAVWAAPWLAGRLVRRRTLAAREAGARAARAEAQAAEARALERDRIARDLHDVVAHAVSVMVVQAGAERLALDGGSPRTSAALEAIETSGRRALVELRAMLGVLRSSGADERTPTPGLAQVPILVDEARGSGLPIQLEVDDGLVDGVPAGLEVTTYRVVQEALTNALRHAGGAPTLVRLTRKEGITIEVSHDLPDEPRPTTVGSGRGLAGMRERVELNGGSLFAGRRDGRWVVTACLPTGDDLT